MKILPFVFSIFIVSSAIGAPTKSVLRVEGMTCASCAGAIEKRLKKVDGVDSVDVSIKTGEVTVTSKDNTKIDPAMAKRAVEAAGYKVIAIDNPK